ncbi:MAG: site-specific DNA-methyltransferase, partial [Thermodesulfobacteriota bacterium]
AQIAVLITLHEPTRAMCQEAAAAGFYQSIWGQYPSLQILTVADLMQGRRIDYPPSTQVNVTFKKAPRRKGTKQQNHHLNFDEEE